MVESFEVESVVRAYHIYNDACMVCCSWNFVISPILPTSNSSFFKRTVWPNLGKTSNGMQQSILCCMFSYPCLLIRASLCSPFVHNGFYHWLYIVINSMNYGVRTAYLVALAWRNSITITKTIIFFHTFVNLETLVNPYGE